MNTAEQVAEKISEWKKTKTKEEVVTLAAKACLGWSYVWGGYGQICNPSNRKAYAERTSCPSAESAVIISKCQVLRKSAIGCSGCQWHPGDTTRFFDCRGFTGWLLQQIGFSLKGAGATSQWNTASNWSSKGEISTIPKDKVCCVFWRDKTDPSKMNHTGMHIGSGVIVHCSGEVKYGSTDEKGWTHWAVPVCFNGDAPVWRPTIRRGSTGDDVKYCQELLLGLGYDLGSYGADGKFGAKTQAAVKDFQASKNLNPDGVVGPLTWEALENTTPTAEFYTVTIPHLPKSQAKNLCDTYAGAKMKKEGG